MNALALVGYVRVSTDEQASSGLGLDAQRAAIVEEVGRRGAVLVAIHEDHASGKSVDKRPGLAAALATLEAGDADGIIVHKLDRLSRSLLDFASLMACSQQQGWLVVALDLGVDTSTPAGELLATVLAGFSQFERRLIGARTREALAELRGRGVHLGRPLSIDDATIRRIEQLRAAGFSYRAVADQLTTDGIPTSRGGAWHAGTVQQALRARQTAPATP